MYAFSDLVLNIVVFRITVVSALDVRIETIEDDGRRDLWTFEDSSLKSQLPSAKCRKYGCACILNDIIGKTSKKPVWSDTHIANCCILYRYNVPAFQVLKRNSSKFKLQ